MKLPGKIFRVLTGARVRLPHYTFRWIWMGRGANYSIKQRLSCVSDRYSKLRLMVTSCACRVPFCFALQVPGAFSWPSHRFPLWFGTYITTACLHTVVAFSSRSTFSILLWQRLRRTRIMRSCKIPGTAPLRIFHGHFQALWDSRYPPIRCH